MTGQDDEDRERRQRAREQIEAYRGAEEDIEKDKAARRPKPVVRNGAWLNAQQFPPLAWAVPGWFPEGMTFQGGGPKSGKSWLSESAGLSIAGGAAILGGIACQPPRPVMYFALEDSDRRIKQRAAQLGWPEVPELFWYTTKAAPDQVLDLMREFLGHYARWRPVAVIDTWGKIMSPALKGETTYDRDYRLGGEVKKYVDDHPGSSVIINHHTRKEGAADFIDLLSGTYGVAGSADTIAILSRKRGELSGKIQITGRDVEEGTYALAGFPCWRIDGADLREAARAAEAAAARAGLGDRSGQILGMVIARGEEVLTQEVALALGISVDAASTYLGRLAKAGRIVKTGRGKWTATVGSVGSVGSPGVGSVGSVGNPGSDQGSIDSTVGSVGSVRNPNIPTEPTVESRARAREDDPDFAELWKKADKRTYHD
jgi:hypothetical protein